MTAPGADDGLIHPRERRPARTGFISPAQGRLLPGQQPGRGVPVTPAWPPPPNDRLAADIEHRWDELLPTPTRQPYDKQMHDGLVDYLTRLEIP